MGTPRPTIRLVAGRLVQPSTGRDFTEDMRALVATWTGRVGGFDGLVSKSRSPSCGLVATKHYASPGATEPIGLGGGAFAAALVAANPELPVIDEARLEADPRARRAFVAAVWARAAARGGQPLSPVPGL